MVELYYKLVKNGRKTLEQVPAKYRDEVKALLDAEEMEGQND